jgi:5-methylcytosine-specific restriction endonuclease McrA
MALKGIRFTEEHKKRISDSMKGLKRSEDTKRRMHESHRGQIPWTKGLKHSEETKRKIGDKLRGERSSSWRGGISFEPYSSNWTQTLKRSIRERDNYTCRLCGLLQCEEAFAVHHIDYNKKNCNPNNLVTLCIICHGKTNHRREYWKEYFSNLII